MRPILFLDLDDVICVNAPYGGYDVFPPKRPDDLWEKLFHKPAVEVLLRIIDEHRPHVVLTTSWLRLMDRGGFDDMFARTGLSKIASALHPTAWEAPQSSGKTRLDAIENWLAANHHQEPFVVLDDSLSGTGLVGSSLHEAGVVVLCELNVGLTSELLDKVRLPGFLQPALQRQPPFACIVAIHQVSSGPVNVADDGCGSGSPADGRRRRDSNGPDSGHRTGPRRSRCRGWSLALKEPDRSDGFSGRGDAAIRSEPKPRGLDVHRLPATTPAQRRHLVTRQ